MDVTQRFYKNIASKIIFLFFLIFPFGQLFSFDIPLFAQNVSVNIVDVLIFLTLPSLLRWKNRIPSLSGLLFTFIVVCVFSLLFSLNFFTLSKVFPGFLYLVRLFSYFVFFVFTWNEIRLKHIARPLLFNSLILVSVFAAVFGWLQYIFLPDLRFLGILGWDNHLYRLAGTFLDPGFTAIILVLGALMSLQKVLTEKKSLHLIAVVFLSITVAFTYSRAAYIALFIGIALSLFFARKNKLILVLLVLTFFTLPLLPRPEGEGVRLERTASVLARLDNYHQTFQIFEKSPIFGIGFNNICTARSLLFGDDTVSHSCSGSDSSLLLILATTGIVGFFVFVNIIIVISKHLRKDVYGLTFKTCLVALLINSIFINSLFYPWLMGYMSVLLAMGLKE